MDRPLADENNPNTRGWTPAKEKFAPAKFPGKKILSEIKEPDLPRSPIPDTNSESCRPYDPETNYLSPRPRFLRYNPNRRREILRRLEKGLDSSSGKSSSCTSSDSNGAVNEDRFTRSNDDSILTSSSSETGSWESDGEESDDSEIQPRRWIFRGVLNYLLLSVVLLLAFPMDPPRLEGFDERAQIHNLESIDGFLGGYETEMVISGSDREVVNTELGSRYKLSGLSGLKIIDTDIKSLEEGIMEDMEFMKVERELPHHMVGYVELQPEETVDNVSDLKIIHTEIKSLEEGIKEDMELMQVESELPDHMVGHVELQPQETVDNYADYLAESLGDVAERSENEASESENSVDEHMKSNAEPVHAVLACLLVVAVGGSVLGLCITGKRRKKLDVVDDKASSDGPWTSDREAARMVKSGEKASYLVGVGNGCVSDHKEPGANQQGTRLAPTVELLAELSVGPMSSCKSLVIAVKDEVEIETYRHSGECYESGAVQGAFKRRRKTGENRREVAAPTPARRSARIRSRSSPSELLTSIR